MRYYSYTTPDEIVEFESTKYIYSEDEILGEYWDYWTDRMREVGRQDLINKETCIDDWKTLHWAVEEDIYKFKSGYDSKIFAINEFNLSDPSFSLATLVCLNDNGIELGRYVNIEQELIKLNGIT